MMNKFYGMLGLAQKAGKLVFGEDGVKNAIKTGKAIIVIVAEDASENTKKKFIDSCTFYKRELLISGTKDNLGHYTGKNERAVIAVCDEGFAKAIKDKINIPGGGLIEQN